MHISVFATSALLSSLASASYWQPSAGTSWQIVLIDELVPPYPNVTAIDGDLFGNNATTWSYLKSQSYRTICYFSAGSYEDWRPDASQFNQTTDIGDPLQGWRGEWWVNTRSENVRRIMSARLDLAMQMGCDAIDPDNMDAYDNVGGGIGLTEDDAVDYISFLAEEAHSRGMAVGLKNAGAIVSRVLDMVQFQINEQCNAYNECSTYQPFIAANKPVFGIEYTDNLSSCHHNPDTCFPAPGSADVRAVCNDPQSQGFSTVIKHMQLDAWIIECNDTRSAVNGTRLSNSSRIAASTPSDTGAASGIVGVSVATILVAVTAAIFAL